MQTSERLVLKQMVVLMRAIGDGQTVNARVTRHQEIVRGIANHDC
jgi:hypothetical protein